MKKLFTSVTQEESIILRDWNDNQSQGYFTGVVLNACEVFSICDGVIVQVEKSIEYFKVVTIQYSADLYVRYLNIETIDSSTIVEGRTIRHGQHIGTTYKKQLLFEICVPDEVSHRWPVRIGKYTLYKVDPLPYLQDESSFHRHLQLTVITDSDLAGLPQMTLTPEMEEEFDGNNKGVWLDV